MPSIRRFAVATRRRHARLVAAAAGGGPRHGGPEPGAGRRVHRPHLQGAQRGGQRRHRQARGATPAGSSDVLGVGAGLSGPGRRRPPPPLPEPITDDDGNQITEAVSTVTWEGGRIEAGQFEEFQCRSACCPMRAGTTFAFPAVQTYDNGDVVRWIDPVVAGQPEPEHPALARADAAGADNESAGGGDIVVVLVGLDRAHARHHRHRGRRRRSGRGHRGADRQRPAGRGPDSGRW